MTMVDNNDIRYRRVEVACANCNKFFGFLMVPEAQPIIGKFYCNLKCINDYEKKRINKKEQLTEKTLSG